jgi:cytoskeletal protein CcmA (bactofilin family)
MAISGFGRGTKGDSSSAMSMPAASSSSSSSSSSSAAGGGGFGNLTAFIDQGSEFEGKLSFKDTVRIDGTFSGEISSDNTLIVGESGQIHASIKSVCVVISGLVEGDIHASEQIVLHKTAVVEGNLDSPAISMEEGAQLNGSVRMGNASSATGHSPAKDAPSPSASGQQTESKTEMTAKGSSS